MALCCIWHYWLFPPSWNSLFPHLLPHPAAHARHHALNISEYTRTHTHTHLPSSFCSCETVPPPSPRKAPPESRPCLQCPSPHSPELLPSCLPQVNFHLSFKTPLRPRFPGNASWTLFSHQTRVRCPFPLLMYHLCTSHAVLSFCFPEWLWAIW